MELNFKAIDRLRESGDKKNMENFVRRMWGLIIQKGITIRELSEISNIPVTKLKLILDVDWSNPCAVELAKLAKALGATMEYMMGMESYNRGYEINGCSDTDCIVKEEEEND